MNILPSQIATASKISILLLALVLGCNCSNQSDSRNVPREIEDEKAEEQQWQIDPIKIPQVVKPYSDLVFSHETSTWTYLGVPYSGYAVRHFPDGSLNLRSAFHLGKKENTEESWYQDGRMRESSEYRHGRLHGIKKRWSPHSNHTLTYMLNYRHGKAHGAQFQWYETGEIYKKMHLNMGKEEGLQQAFRKNGDLYANYEAKNGRVYGLQKAALCFGLEDEKLYFER